MGAQHKHWFLLLTLVCIWGTSFMFTAVAVEVFSPVLLTLLRLVLGASVLTAVVYLRGLRLPFGRKAWGAFFLLGLIGNALPFFLIAWGQQSVNSATAGALMSTAPLMTVFLAHFFIQDERLNRFKLLGFSVSLGGVYLLLSPNMDQQSTLLGALAILSAAGGIALNTVLMRRLPHFHPLVGSAGMLIMAMLLMLPLAATQDLTLARDPELNELFALIWLGIMPTGIASILCFAIVSRAGASFLANANYMVPMVAFLCGALVLGERITWLSLLALAVILGGIALSRRQPG